MIEGNRQQPIKHSNEYKPTAIGWIFSIIFALTGVGFLGLGLYLGSTYGDWWVLIFCLPISAVLVFFALAGLPFQNEIYSYELKEDGIYQQWENKKTGKTKKGFIPFSKVQKVIAGMNPVNIGSAENNPQFRYYRYDATLWIIHEDGIFSEHFWKKEDFQRWTSFLKDKVPITYTHYDLTSTLSNAKYVNIDFTKIEGSSEDVVSRYIGKEGTDVRFHPWIPENLKEEIEKNKLIQSRLRTKKAEKNMLWLILIYAIFIAAYLFPKTPLDEDGFLEFTDQIILLYLIVYFIIPSIFVLLRTHTKWFTPIIYTIALIIGNYIGLFIASIFTELPNLHGSIFVLNIYVFILWCTVLFTGKAVRFVANFLK